MTQSISINAHDNTAQASDGGPQTTLDCDVLTIARSVKACAKAAANNKARRADPLDHLYRPLGNPDVINILRQR